MTLYRGVRPIDTDELHGMIIACRAAQERAQAAVAHSPNGRTRAWLATVTADLDRLLENLPRTMPGGRMTG